MGLHTPLDSRSEHSPLLYRPRLLRRLKAALTRGHVLISAPPGFGKSALLRSLLTERPFTHHVILTPADLDLAYLRAHLEPLLYPGATLLLDDVHLVADGSDVVTWLASLLDAATPHLLLSGRMIPPALIAEVDTSAGRVTTLDASDLAFSLAESRALLQHTSYTPDSIGAWHTRTQGWPLALGLLAQQPATAEHALELPLIEADLFTYLAQVVLAGLPPALQQFMERTALPLRFNDDLAAQLIDARTEAAVLRDEVQRRNLFLEPTEEPGWFRYHALVREFLLHRDPDNLTRYAERVIAWFEAHDDIPMAIEHALAAGMAERAARLMEPLAALFVARTGRLRTFRRWIEALDERTRARFPLLSTRLGLDYANFSQYETAREWLDRGVALAEQVGGTTLVRARLDFAAYLVHYEENATATLALITPLLDLPDLAPGMRRMVLKQMGVALQFQGKYGQSAHMLRKALALPEAPDGPLDSVLYQNLYIAWLEQGQWRRAEHMLWEYERRASGDPSRRMRVLRSWAWLHEEMGDWDALERDIRAAEVLEQQLEQAGANHFEWSRLRALLAIGRGDLDTGAALLADTSSPDAESSQVYWYIYLAWIARRRGQPEQALSLVEDVLAQSGNAPTARALLALEGDIAAWESGYDRPLHAETGTLIRLRIRSQLIRLRALLALRCWRAGDPRWRHHVRRTLHTQRAAHYRLLLTQRDPELGKHFWPLVLVAGIVDDEALAALATLGDGCALIALLRHPDAHVRERAAWGLGALGQEAAHPHLVAALEAETVPRTADALETALNALEALPPPRLDVELMGGCVLRRDGVVLAATIWPRPIVLRVFLYFALHRGQTLSRERIVEDLWPQDDRDSAWTKFRTVYSLLRNVLEPDLRPKATGRYFAVSDEGVCFDPHGRVHVDAEQFVTTVRAALPSLVRQTTPASLAPVPALSEALERWAPLLPDLPYEEWLLEPRERLHALYAEGCLAVAQAHLADHELREAIRWAERVVSAAPWLEEGYQTLMLAQARLGQRSLALKTYADGVRAIEREIGIPPSDQTVALVTRLERGDEI